MGGKICTQNKEKIIHGQKWYKCNNYTIVCRIGPYKGDRLCVQIHWVTQVYMKEWNKYIRMLQFNKRNYITAEVIKATNTCRQLFQIIEGLLGRNEGNPIPQDADDIQLAEDFADYFLGKIKKNQGKFQGQGTVQSLTTRNTTTHQICTSQRTGTGKANSNYASQVMPTRCYLNRQTQRSTRPVHPSCHVHH